MDNISLPGRQGARITSTGGGQINGSLPDAARAVAQDCEKLLCNRSAESFLRFSGMDIPAPFPVDFSNLRLSCMDSLHKYVPGGLVTIALLAETNTELRRAFAALSAAERVELGNLVRGFEFWRDQWPGYPLQRMLELSGRVDRKRLADAGALMALCARTIRESLPLPGAAPAEVQTYHTPWGDIVLGTPGDDTYHGPAALLIIDPGGDDSYHLQGANWPAVNMIIDSGGDDSYCSPGGYALGGALMGVSWLEDFRGDDSYSSGPFSQGAGALGVGVLIDREGNDSYRGEYLCQGASFFGIGVLIDMEGEDTYGADFGAQGANFAAGEALLADLGGDDFYRAGGRFRDWRSRDATKSFAQGCAAGIRPFTQGGRAVLFDREGEDSFEISYLGQGAGYWGGYGLLVSGGGDDSYSAERYAQGCGLHFALGALVDLNGEDSYTLEGVGQGAGEDRAWGILLEGSGDDVYNSVRLARGAGGAGGIGLLLELAGDDTYPAAGQLTGGAGSRTWELPGLGFMFEMSGDDSYGDGHADGQLKANGVWGARLDFLQGN